MVKSKKKLKAAKPKAGESSKKKRGGAQVFRRVHADLGEMVMTTDDLQEIRKQLVRAGRIAGSRLMVRIDGA